MRGLIRTVCFLSVMAIPAACGWQPWSTEPSYQGRSTSHWIRKLGQAHVPSEWGRSPSKPAIDALRAIGPAAVPSCIEGLKHEDWRTRAGSADALGLYGAGAKPAVPTLAAAVTDRNEIVRRLAVASLFKIGDADAAIPVLSAQLAHQDPVIRFGVASTLARMNPGRDDAYRVLIDGLQYVDTEFRNAVNAWGPREHKYDRAMEVQKDGRRFFNREDAGRAAAAKELGGLGPDAKRAIPQLIAAHENRRYYATPAAAALALGEIGPDARAAVPALLETLSSVERRLSEQAASPGLVEAACTALGKIGLTAEELPPLYRMLEIPHTSYNAIPLAFAGAPPEAVRSLFDRMSSSDAFAARRAAQALGKMGPRAQAGIPVLVTALRHEDPLVRMHAATALGTIKVSDATAVSALRGLLEDPDRSVRSAASSALEKLNPNHRGPVPPK